jgi:Mg/Co/Ni transporter MgtE
VNHNPARVYQIMQAPVAYGPNMRVSDAVELSFGPGVLVADHGKLLGVVTREALGVARGDHELHEVMDSGVFLSAEDEIGEAIELIEAYDGGIVPVIDDQARLVGRVSARDLPTRSLK